MEVDCPPLLLLVVVVVVAVAVDSAVGWPPAVDKTVAVVVETLAVGKLASVAVDTVAVEVMVRAVELG